MRNRELFKQKVFFVDSTTGEVISEYENAYTSVPQRTTVDVPDALHQRYDYLTEPIDCPYGEKGVDDEPGVCIPASVREEISNQRKERISLQFGPFYWLRITRGKIFRPDCDPAALARAFYVGVHNFLGDRFDPARLGMKHGVKKAIKELSDTELFVGDISPENFNRNIMWRGRIGDVTDGLCGKLFECQYKSAMELNGPNKHRQIGRIVQLIPFVHRYTNILCKDSKSVSFDFGSQFTKKDVSDLFGVSPKNSCRFMNELLELKFMRNGREYPVMYEAAYGDQRVFCINHRFYYAADILQGDHICVPAM